MLAFILAGCIAQRPILAKAQEMREDHLELTGASTGVRTPFEKYGRLSVKDGRLVGKKGQTVQLKGVSSH